MDFRSHPLPVRQSSNLKAGRARARQKLFVNEDVWDAAHAGDLEHLQSLLTHARTVDHLHPRDDVPTEKNKRAAKSSSSQARRAVQGPRPSDHATPVFAAAAGGFVQVVEFLASLGADLAFPRHDGATPFYIACLMGHLPVAAFIATQLGPQVLTDKTHNESTALSAAVSRGRLTVVTFLVDMSRKTLTPQQFKRFLLRRCAKGLTSVQLARKKGHGKLSAFLEWNLQVSGVNKVVNGGVAGSGAVGDEDHCRALRGKVTSKPSESKTACGLMAFVENRGRWASECDDAGVGGVPISDYGFDLSTGNLYANYHAYAGGGTSTTTNPTAPSLFDCIGPSLKPRSAGGCCTTYNVFECLNEEPNGEPKRNFVSGSFSTVLHANATPNGKAKASGNGSGSSFVSNSNLGWVRGVSGGGGASGGDGGGQAQQVLRSFEAQVMASAAASMDQGGGGSFMSNACGGGGNGSGSGEGSSVGLTVQHKLAASKERPLSRAKRKAAEAQDSMQRGDYASASWQYEVAAGLFTQIVNCGNNGGGGGGEATQSSSFSNPASPNPGPSPVRRTSVVDAPVGSFPFANLNLDKPSSFSSSSQQLQQPPRGKFGRSVSWSDEEEGKQEGGRSGNEADASGDGGEEDGDGFSNLPPFRSRAPPSMTPLFTNFAATPPAAAAAALGSSSSSSSFPFSPLSSSFSSDGFSPSKRFLSPKAAVSSSFDYNKSVMTSSFDKSKQSKEAKKLTAEERREANSEARVCRKMAEHCRRAAGFENDDGTEPKRG